jgi:hypothetical protein
MKKYLARYAGVFVLLLILLLIVPGQVQKCAGGLCNAGSDHCTSNCCLGVRISDHVMGCTVVNHVACSPVWTNGTWNEYCPAGGCAVTVDQKKCTWVGWNNCRLDDYYIADGCCMAGSPPAPTEPPPSATDTPTSTPTATATRTPTATPTPIPLRASLVARHPSLVLMASKLGQPAQLLGGTISGGSTPYNVIIHVVRPDGSSAAYSLTSGTSFSFGASQAADPDFGTTQQGTWRAWLSVTSGTQSAVSNTVVWNVAFYVVHERP